VIVLGDIRAFAPDELSYINSFQELYKSTFDISQFGGWWNAQTIFLRALYLPAQFFSFLPISDLVLLRLYSITLTATALFLLVKHTKLTNTNLGKVVLVVFTFTPSIFLWTTLAIKESFILITLVVFFLGLERIHKVMGISGYFICFLAGYSLLNLKGYLYVILTLAVSVVIFAKSIKQIKLDQSSVLLILIIAMPYMISPSTAALIRESSIGFIDKLSEFRVVDEIIQTDSSGTDSSGTDSSGTDSSGTDSSGTDSSGNSLDLGTTLNLLNKKAGEDSLFDSILSFLQVDDFLNRKAETYIESSSQDIYSNRTLNPVDPTDIKGFAYGISAFLFFPNTFRSNGSPVLDLLGFEVFFWIFLYLVTLYIGFRSRSYLMRFIPISIMTFGSIFLIISEMTEINLGTAVRHRLVLAILIVIFIGSQNFSTKGNSTQRKK
jgi:hypothetical protein